MQEKRSFTEYAIVLNEKDNVATALGDMPEGDYVLPSPESTSVITVRQHIKGGFKVAVSHIHPGDKVYKYGHVIGVAVAEIRPGDCVHIHNMTSCHSPRGSDRI